MIRIQFSLLDSNRVEAYFRFLTRDPRFARKRRQEQTLGFTLILGFGFSLAMMGVESIWVGALLALIATLYVIDYEYFALNRLRKKIAKRIPIHNDIEESIYVFNENGLLEKTKFYAWLELHTIDLHETYMALVFKEAFVFLPAQAFAQIPKQSVLEFIQSHVPEIKIQEIKK